MAQLINEHPGIFLTEDFMQPLEVTAYRLAKEIDVPVSRIDDIISGKRGISSDTAMRFAQFFGTTAVFWTNLQADYERRELARTKADVYKRIKPLATAKAGSQ